MKVQHAKGDPKSLVLLERNARYMRQETFATLVANIRKDGVLTQWPWVYADPETGDRVVHSGNHRVKAAIAAGLDEIDWIETDTKMSKAELLGIQLSHNSIQGEDDPTLLKELYDEIDDIDFRQYAGLDDKTLELLEMVDVEGLSEAALEYQSIGFVFLPEELEDALAAFDQAAAVTGALAHYTASYPQYAQTLDAIDDARGSHTVGNIAVGLEIVLDIFRRNVTELRDGYAFKASNARNAVPAVSLIGYTVPTKEAKRIAIALTRAEKEGTIEHPWEPLLDWADNGPAQPAEPPEDQKDWVPIADIIGTAMIPPDSARIIAQGIARMTLGDQVSPTAPWLAVEYWAADHLAAANED